MAVNNVFRIKKEEELKEVAQALLVLIKNHHVFALNAEMGVGKTTFISYLAREMGIEEPISSPTFGYVNEYFSDHYGTVYHFDLYRLNDEVEAYDIGIEEYLYGDALVFIEWPKVIENLLPENCVWVNMFTEDDGIRRIEFEYED